MTPSGDAFDGIQVGLTGATPSRLWARMRRGSNNAGVKSGAITGAPRNGASTRFLSLSRTGGSRAKCHLRIEVSATLLAAELCQGITLFYVINARGHGDQVERLGHGDTSPAHSERDLVFP